MIIAGAASRLVAGSRRSCRPGTGGPAAPKPPASQRPIATADRTGGRGRDRRSTREAVWDDPVDFPDLTPLPSPVRAAAAARAFAAGNGYLTGLIVDRLA